MKTHKLRIRLQSYDQRVLERSAYDIVDAAKRTGVRIAGPIPLPTKRKIITVIRSPHVDKRSQEQFEMRTFTLLLDIIQPTAETVDRLKGLPIAAGVNIKIRA